MERCDASGLDCPCASLNDAGQDIAATFVLRGSHHDFHRRAQITSAYRDEQGVPIAGFHAILIIEIELIHPWELSRGHSPAFGNAR